ncbi:DUF1194 domain-containing protein [Breoghania sp. L-A4]|uniref:DUF1194 domain-containing protein n=1 Tax=Breoghania sp. L-A4 TaxID=2304600 RepID=UPI000E35E166|nr:DUF1194 domain-containing protein [Breoghania sp. L-A4]AXS42401.1 DUF1194 domain-containing protein [Breoghania sp. L-A4]
MRRVQQVTKTAIAAVAAAVIALPASAASPVNYDPAAEVDVELILAVDISQSMDDDEQTIQRKGYVSALTSPEVLEAIRIGPTGRIAVAYVEWGGDGEQYIVADWQIIDGPDTAAVFASKVAEAPLRQVQRTSITSALSFSVAMIDDNQYFGLRRVIDMSGDGPNNQGGQVTQARDLALTKGITINGLPLMMKGTGTGWYHMPNLDHYYEDCVIGGPGAFTIPVHSKDSFADAIRMKLVLEVAGLSPNPANGRDTVMFAKGRRMVPCDLFN